MEYNNQFDSVAMIYPTDSLSSQMAGWALRHRGVPVRSVHWWDAAPVGLAMAGAPRVVVDATEHPGAALAVLECGLERLPAERLVVYSEQTHPGLEVFVRSRGVTFLLGPMGPEEWDALLKPAAAEETAAAGWPGAAGDARATLASRSAGVQERRMMPRHPRSK